MQCPQCFDATPNTNDEQTCGSSELQNPQHPVLPILKQAQVPIPIMVVAKTTTALPAELGINSVQMQKVSERATGFAAAGYQRSVVS
jgi:hypothetical protein